MDTRPSSTVVIEGQLTLPSLASAQEPSRKTILWFFWGPWGDFWRHILWAMGVWNDLGIVNGKWSILVVDFLERSPVLPRMTQFLQDWHSYNQSPLYLYRFEIRVWPNHLPPSLPQYSVLIPVPPSFTMLDSERISKHRPRKVFKYEGNILILRSTIKTTVPSKLSTMI